MQFCNLFKAENHLSAVAVDTGSVRMLDVNEGKPMF